MMKHLLNRLGLVGLFTTVGFILVLSYLVFDFFNRPKTGYVIIQEVYEGFDYKKEMEKKFNMTKNSRKKIADSLAFELKIFGKKLDAQKKVSDEQAKAFNLKREEYFQRTKVFNEDNEQLLKQYNQEVLSQMNQYIGDYGKVHHFQYIFGNEGNGSLMHADDKLNITKEVIGFINAKYHGNK